MGRADSGEWVQRGATVKSCEGKGLYPGWGEGCWAQGHSPSTLLQVSWSSSSHQMPSPQTSSVWCCKQLVSEPFFGGACSPCPHLPSTSYSPNSFSRVPDFKTKQTKNPTQIKQIISLVVTFPNINGLMLFLWKCRLYHFPTWFLLWPQFLQGYMGPRFLDLHPWFFSPTIHSYATCEVPLKWEIFISLGCSRGRHARWVFQNCLPPKCLQIHTFTADIS